MRRMAFSAGELLRDAEITLPLAFYLESMMMALMKDGDCDPDDCT